MVLVLLEERLQGRRQKLRLLLVKTLLILLIVVAPENLSLDSSSTHQEMGTLYNSLVNRLKAPDGQMYHIAYGDKQRLQVIDVFESQAKLDAFGAKLMPILQEMGIEAKPTVFETYNIIID